MSDIDAIFAAEAALRAANPEKVPGYYTARVTVHLTRGERFRLFKRSGIRLRPDTTTEGDPKP